MVNCFRNGKAAAVSAPSATHRNRRGVPTITCARPTNIFPTPTHPPLPTCTYRIRQLPTAADGFFFFSVRYDRRSPMIPTEYRENGRALIFNWIARRIFKNNGSPNYIFLFKQFFNNICLRNSYGKIVFLSMSANRNSER